MKFPYLIPPIGFIEIVDLSFPGKTMLFLKQRKQLAAKIKSTLFNDRQFQFFLFFICCCENAGRSCPLKYALIRLFFLMHMFTLRKLSSKFGNIFIIWEICNASYIREMIRRLFIDLIYSTFVHCFTSKTDDIEFISRCLSNLGTESNEIVNN